MELKKLPQKVKQMYKYILKHNPAIFNFEVSLMFIVYSFLGKLKPINKLIGIFNKKNMSITIFLIYTLT